MAEFAFKQGARLQKGAHADPQIIGEHLAFLQSEHDGKLTPEMLLEDAKSGNSPLHPLFEWDDSEAARKYRLQQASGIIRAVVIRYREDDDGEAKTVRAFIVTQKDDGTSHYLGAVEAMSDDDIRAQTIRKAWDDLQRFRARYAGLVEFAGLFTNLEDIERSLPPIIGLQ